MKHIFCALAAIAGFLYTTASQAQTTPATDTVKVKHHHALVISNRGIRIETNDSITKTKAGKMEIQDENKKRRFSTTYGLLDLGINLIQDNTNYNDPAVKNYLSRIPANMQNKSLFDLRSGKSINVNIYPCMVKFAALRTHNQRIFISTGLGFQLYNFRYESPLTYTKNPTGVILDSTTFKKDKLGIDYLNVPLMFTFKTRLSKNRWLVYGAGITEGYRISSWNKQVSGEFGKVKNHDAYGLADLNTCVSAEFGVDGIFRFYASYQLTSMYSGGLDQHPISFGFRFDGI